MMLGKLQFRMQFFKILESLRHSQSSRDISGHRTRPLPLPIRLQSGLLHEQNGYSSYQRSQERAREYHFTKLEIDGYI